jgi:hypothetical protein
MRWSLSFPAGMKFNTVALCTRTGRVCDYWLVRDDIKILGIN